ncbi:ABC transporter ATP-binding protein [Salinarimonas rosea]|uniref:ABC transporter ATP-binding protein n=1 Tax=Salinarimonas rosea TaxID=552063 RepID=UPI0003F8EFC2|nr:sn-glycerol-3-phosphate ABC transporter ATP-binding protein UgpC [Salinarimonas rosea]
MADLAIRALKKSYGATPAVRGVDLTIPAGEFAVLVGPSGCGKSTLLRTIAGLEEADGGSIEIGGRVATDLRPKDRDIAMVFQNYALYPYLTVFENVAFGLRARKLPDAEVRKRVGRAAEMLGLGPLLERYPRQLSGGQRQRVAIGRAIVRDARLFLFDEPLSNLDAQLRDEMRGELKRLHQELGKTFMYVTHDQTEAMTLADRIVVLKDGLIEQQGSPLDLYERPRTRFVAGFIGSPQMNFIPAEVAPGRGLRLSDGRELPLKAGRLAGIAPGAVLIGLRPTHIARAGAQPPATGVARLSVRADLIQPTGARAYVSFRLGGVETTTELEAREAPRLGEEFAVDLDLDRAVLIDPQTDRVI